MMTTMQSEQTEQKQNASTEPVKWSAVRNPLSYNDTVADIDRLNALMAEFCARLRSNRREILNIKTRQKLCYSLALLNVIVAFNALTNLLVVALAPSSSTVSKDSFMIWFIALMGFTILGVWLFYYAIRSDEYLMHIQVDNKRLASHLLPITTRALEYDDMSRRKIDVTRQLELKARIEEAEDMIGTVGYTNKRQN